MGTYFSDIPRFLEGYVKELTKVHFTCEMKYRYM